MAEQEQQQQQQGQGEGGLSGQETPQIDIGVLQASLQQTLKDSLADLAKQAQPAPQPVPQNVDPVAQVMAPYLQPVYQQTGYAVDAATFYATTPQAGKHSAKIEELARQYPTTPRAHLWQYLKGDDAYINERVEQTLRERQEAAEKAAQGQTVGAGGYPQRGFGQPREASALTPQELDAALDGISF